MELVLPALAGVVRVVKVVELLAVLVTPYPSVVSRLGRAAEMTVREKKRSGAWPGEVASAGAKANGSFARVKGRNYLLRSVRLLLVFEKLHLTSSCERSPLLCMSGKISCVLDYVSDIAASMVRLRRVSKVYKYAFWGYTATSCCACGGICCETVVSSKPASSHQQTISQKPQSLHLLYPSCVSRWSLMTSTYR